MKKPLNLDLHTKMTKQSTSVREAQSLIEKIAGSVKVDAELLKTDVDVAIRISKHDRFPR